MRLTPWLSLFSKSPTTRKLSSVQAKRRARAVLNQLECLEDRVLLSTLYVDNTPGGVTNFTPVGGTLAPQGGLTLNSTLFTTISAAVSHAVDGDEIQVADGTYNEFVLIDKTLTIKGNQFGVDARTGRGANESVIDGSGLGGIVRISAANKTIVVDGFSMTADASISVFNNGYGAAVTTVQSSGLTGLNISHNIIQHASIGITPQGNSAVIQYNLIRDIDIAGPAAGSGIYTDFGLTNSTIDSNKLVNITNTAININSSGSNNIVSNNVMDSQIYLDTQSGSQITGNVITNSAAGGIVLGGNQSGIVVTNNEVNGVASGFSALRVRNDAGGANSNVTVTGNKFVAGASGFGVRPGAGGYTGTLTLTGNQISGGTAAIQNDDGALTIDASGVYWGSSVPATVSATILGAGAAIVDFTPLLDNNESNVAVGFQVDASSFTVHSLGIQVAGGRIQEAINLQNSQAVPIYTGAVNVLTGTYTETISGQVGLLKLATGAVANLSGTVNGVMDGGVGTLNALGTGTVGTLVIGDATNNGGGVTPDGLKFTGAGTLALDISSVASHDLLDVNGTVALGTTATLSLTVGAFVPADGAEIILIDNDGAADQVTGTFATLADGAIISSNFGGSGKTARITYHGGDGNDVAIRVDQPIVNIPAPTPDGNPDVFQLVVVGNTLEVLLNGVVIDSRPLAGIQNLTINGSTDNDTLNVNFTGGDPIPLTGLTFNGGAGFDRINLINVGGTFTTHTYNYTNANDGSIVLNDGTNHTITYTGLEPITNDGTPTNVIFNLPNTADASITLDDLGAGLARLTTTLPAFEQTDFAYPAAGGSITINTGALAQTITVQDLVLNANTDLTIAGDANDTVTFSPTASVTITDALSVTAGTINQTAEILVTGTTTLNATATGTITLTDVNNDFGGNVTVTATTTLSIDDDDDVTFSTLNASGAVAIDAGGAVDFAGAAAVGGTLIVDVNANGGAGAAITDSTGSVTVTGTTTLDAGTGNITLDAATNDFTDVVSISAANDVTLVDATDLSLGASTVTGNLVVDADDIDLTGAVAVTGNADLDAGVDDVTDSTGSITVGGTTALEAADDIVLDAAANNFTGAVSISTANDVTLNDTNAIVFGNSTITGALVVTANGTITDIGVVQVTGTTTLTAGGANNIVLDNANSFATVVIISGNDVTIRDDAGFDIGAANVTGTYTVSSNGTITQSVLLSTIGGLTKLGSGTLALNLANTYTTTTNINAGTLMLTGSLSTGITNINNSAILRGTGSIAGPLNVNNTARVAPGVAGPGTLTLASVTFSTTAFLDVDLNGLNAGTQYDQLVVSGAVDLGGASGATLTPTVGFGAQPYDRFSIINKTGAGPVVGTFEAHPEGSIYNTGARLRVSYVEFHNTTSSPSTPIFYGDGNDVSLTVMTPPIVVTQGVNGDLTLDGTGWNDDITLSFTGTNQLTLIGNDVSNFSGPLTTNVQAAGPYTVTGNITIKLGNGKDKVLIRGVGANATYDSGDLTIDLGSDDDTVTTIDSATPPIATAGLKMTGNISIIGGAGTDNVTLGSAAANDTLLARDVTIDTGTGLIQTISLDRLTATRNVTLTNGGSAAQTVAMGVNAANMVTGNLIINQTASASSYTVGLHNTSVGGFLTVTNGSGSGAAAVTIDTTTAQSVNGATTITNGNNLTNAVTIVGTTGGLQLKGSIAIKNGTATNTNGITITDITDSGNSATNLTNGASPANTITFDGALANTFLGLVTATNGASTGTNVINATRLSSTKGINLNNGTATTTNTVAIGGAAVASAVSVTGNLVISNGTAGTTTIGIDRLTTLGANAVGNVTINDQATGAGGTGLTFGANAANSISGNLQITNQSSTGTRSVLMNQTTVSGRTGVNIYEVGTGNTSLTIGNVALSTISKGLVVQDGTGSSTVSLQNLTVGSFNYLDLGGGTDTMALADTAGTFRVNGVTRIDTGAGSDTVRIATTGTAILNDTVFIALGAGNDLLFIGPNADSPAFNSAAKFMFDGGSGDDTFNASPLSIAEYSGLPLAKKVKSKIMNFEHLTTN